MTDTEEVMNVAEAVARSIVETQNDELVQMFFLITADDSVVIRPWVLSQQMFEVSRDEWLEFLGPAEAFVLIAETIAIYETGDDIGTTDAFIVVGLEIGQEPRVRGWQIDRTQALGSSDRLQSLSSVSLPDHMSDWLRTALVA